MDRRSFLSMILASCAAPAGDTASQPQPGLGPGTSGGEAQR